MKFAVSGGVTDIDEEITAEQDIPKSWVHLHWSSIIYNPLFGTDPVQKKVRNVPGSQP